MARLRQTRQKSNIHDRKSVRRFVGASGDVAISGNPSDGVILSVKWNNRWYKIPVKLVNQDSEHSYTIESLLHRHPSNVTIAGDLTVNGEDTLFTSATASEPVVTIQNTNNGATSGYLKFVNDKNGAGADDDVCGTITFYGDDDNQDNIEFARIEGIVADASNTAEGGSLKLSVASHDGEMNQGILVTDGSAEDEIDVTIGNGINSLVTASGSITASKNISVPATGKLYLDSATTHTYITETSDDVLDIYVGGDNVMKIDEGSLKITFPVGIRQVASGFHGSTTKIKILPSDFHTDSSRALVFDSGTGGIKLGIASADMWATVPIPTGYKATNARLDGNAAAESIADACKLYETDINSATITTLKDALGADAEENIGTEVDFVDHDSDGTNFIVIQAALTATTDIVYGGYVTIAPI